jgi:hypothetical protein
MKKAATEPHEKENPPELLAPVWKMRLWAIAVGLFSAYFFYAGFAPIKAGDWTHGLRGPAILLVLPALLVSKHLAARWAAAIEVAFGVVLLFAAIALLAMAEQGKRALLCARQKRIK